MSKMAFPRLPESPAEVPAAVPQAAEPLKIGSLTLEHRVLPAPMCGISDRPTRTIAREMGVSLAYTQMFSSEGIVRSDRHTWDLIDIDGEPDAEGPVAVQLFGGNPKSLGEAARIIQDRGVALVDLNMGCPARKVTGNMCGAALMKEPRLVGEIMTEMRRGCPDVPLTAKFRAGWDDGSRNLIEIGKICQDAGADAVCLHPRTREQRFTGRSAWDLIGELKAALSIPVIGNGDIQTPEDALRMMHQTGCDAVMLGRAWLGNPWVLRDCVNALHHPEADRPRRDANIPEDYEEVKSPHVGLEERLQMLLFHGELMARWKGERRGMIELRKHGVQYVKGLRHAKTFKHAFLSVQSLDELNQLVNRMLEQLQKHGDLPSLAEEDAAAESPAPPAEGSPAASLPSA